MFFLSSSVFLFFFWINLPLTSIILKHFKNTKTTNYIDPSYHYCCSATRLYPTLQYHGLQHTRLLCPPLSLGVWSNSCPLSWRCYLTISSSATTPTFAFSLSQHQGLSQGISSLHQVAKVLELQLQHQCDAEWKFRKILSFRIDWFDPLAVQGTLNSLLLHHSSKASVLQCSAFFMVQFSHPYMATRKTVALTRWTFIGKMISLLFNMLSRLVITFLQRSKHLLISWLQSPSVVILEPKKIMFSVRSWIFRSYGSSTFNFFFWGFNFLFYFIFFLAIHFTYDNLTDSVLFSHIIPPLHAPTESKRLFKRLFNTSKWKWKWSHSVVSNSLHPHGL